eukprot:scaffold4732_cov100-Skeletonema_marinoi.AAC.4
MLYEGIDSPTCQGITEPHVFQELLPHSPPPLIQSGHQHQKYFNTTYHNEVHRILRRATQRHPRSFLRRG